MSGSLTLLQLMDKYKFIDYNKEFLDKGIRCIFNESKKKIMNYG